MQILKHYLRPDLGFLKVLSNEISTIVQGFFLEFLLHIHPINHIKGSFLVLNKRLYLGFQLLSSLLRVLILVNRRRLIVLSSTQINIFLRGFFAARISWLKQKGLLSKVGSKNELHPG